MIGILAFSFSLVSEAAPSSYSLPIKVEAIPGKTYSLKITVWNCTGKALTVPLANFPWGQHRLGLVLYSAGKLTGEPLQQAIKIADFPLKEIIVRTQSSVSGVINLNDEFPTLSRYKSKKDIVAFWVYERACLTEGRLITLAVWFY